MAGLVPSTAPTDSANPCLNILYPLAPGRQWTYKITRTDDADVIVASLVSTSGNKAFLNISDRAAGSNTTATVMCSHGAITGLPSLEVGYLFYGSGTSLILRSLSTTLAPTEGDLADNNWNFAWRTNLLATGHMTIENPSLGEIEFIIKNAPVEIDWQTAGAGDAAFESIKTPAGAFPHALKIYATASFQMLVKVKIQGQSQSLPAVLGLTATLWCQPYVGLVKQSFDSAQLVIGENSYPAGITTTMELTGYDFPS